MSPQARRFGHPARELAFWRRLAKEALAAMPTPFYLFSLQPIREALGELKSLEKAIPRPIRHWLSFKTQPVRPLLNWWQRQGWGVEVVSEFELLAALGEGFPPQRILVNGPAKHRWLAQHPLVGLRVNFDSATEAQTLMPLARRLNWSLGVRCQTSQEVDPDHPTNSTQFGMPARELVPWLRRWLPTGLHIDTLHFHLRTNVPSANNYARAVAEVADLCEAAGFRPRNLDVGGGFPAPHVLSPAGRPLDAEFNLSAFGQIYARALDRFPALEEIWFENGRFLTARSGVLVLRIQEIKERDGLRFLICDGGRTMNALVSDWETHQVLAVPARKGAACLTAVCGPTCMAFDQLTLGPMPGNLEAGDHLLWMDAGAYHISWETRFSHGAAGVLWHDAHGLQVAREPESFAQWWDGWKEFRKP